MNRRALVADALCALEAGDQSGAAELLLEALSARGDRPPPCSVCGVRAWPGDTVRHVYSEHHPPRERAA